MKKKSKKSLAYLFVISFGFLNGFWFALGINPQDVIFEFLKKYLDNVHPWVHIAFVILPLILLFTTIITILSIYRKGGLLGAFLVLLAFVAGLAILKSTVLSLVVLAACYLLGLFVFKNK